MTLDTFLITLESKPESIDFSHTMEVIDNYFDFTPTAFINGATENQAGQNNGSCKVFAFGKLKGLGSEKTLHCFGDYYRKDVLENPSGDDHQNIRNFMVTGWEGIQFDGEPLALKS